MGNNSALYDPLTPGKIFPIAEARRLIDGIYDNREIDTVEPFHNFFFYEVCPLLAIAEQLTNKPVSIMFMGSDSRFDGLLYLGPERTEQRVEMVSAIDGYNDALRMELLTRRGHAPAFQDIEANGTKRNRKFGENATEAIHARNYDNGKVLPMLRAALADVTP